jgi:hypothetical protein
MSCRALAPPAARTFCALFWDTAAVGGRAPSRLIWRECGSERREHAHPRIGVLMTAGALTFGRY